ncbi:MAG: ChbG/HpnK family deacetylase [Bryobacterales bacterium]|nr:ChbG/HpnK family deacetylase [Bryobacterales bacterium]
MASKRLVVNADDFGFTADVNQGILDAHRDGILTSATLMANGDAFDHAVRLSHENPSLDVGCHLVLVGGRSLLDGQPFPASVPDLLKRLVRGSIRVYDELAAQVRRIRESGVRPTHLDTHKHTHLAPPVLNAVARISAESGIRWVRRPFDVPMDAAAYGIPAGTRRISLMLRLMRGYTRHVLKARGCRSTDHFAGFQITGRYGPAELVRLIQNLPEGVTEFMCHPGRCGEELRQTSTRLKESRVLELAALTAPEVRQAARDSGVQIVSFRDLSV